MAAPGWRAQGRTGCAAGYRGPLVALTGSKLVRTYVATVPLGNRMLQGSFVVETCTLRV